MRTRIFAGVLTLLVAVSVMVTNRPPIKDNPLPDTGYDLDPISAPLLTGLPLKIASELLTTPIIGQFLATVILNGEAIDELQNMAYHLDVIPQYMPFRPATDAELHSHQTKAQSAQYNAIVTSDETRASILGKAKTDTGVLTVEYIYNGYKSGAFTPMEFAQQTLEKAAQLEHLNLFIALHRKDVLAQAKQSTQRWSEGKPLSALDGVPIGIKDEFRVKGYKTTHGTSFMGDIHGIEDDDEIIIARLRAAGAIIFGKLNMHEVGISTNSINPVWGNMPNPWATAIIRDNGGSSSASAASVAANLFPITVGADGGGSIRIPASMNGVVGLSTTFLRIPYQPGFCWSMLHQGFLTSTVRDQMLAYSAVSGGIDGNRYTNPATSSSNPPIHFDKFDDSDLSDLTIGIFWDWFSDADPKTVKACDDTVSALVNQFGAQLKNITIPHLRAVKKAHFTTIMAEFMAGLEKEYREGFPFAPNTKLSLAVGDRLTSTDVIAASKIRGWLMDILNDIFTTQGVDILITPGIGFLPPPISEASKSYGESSSWKLGPSMRFVYLSNLAGIPAMVQPVAYVEEAGDTLPISIQLMATHWAEDKIFRMARVIEDELLGERKFPPRVNHVPLQ